MGVSAFAVGRDGGVGGGASQDCFVGERALVVVGGGDIGGFVGESALAVV